MNSNTTNLVNAMFISPLKLLILVAGLFSCSIVMAQSITLLDTDGDGVDDIISACDCDDDMNFLDDVCGEFDGTVTFYHDVVTVVSAMAGETWTITVTSGDLYTDDGITTADGMTLVDVGGGIYNLDVYHATGAGYTIDVSDGATTLMTGNDCADPCTECLGSNTDDAAPIYAVATCADVDPNMYNIDVTNNGTVDANVTVAGESAVVGAGATGTFGPFVHSVVGGAMQSVSLDDCACVIDVAEVLCEVAPGGGQASAAYCACDFNGLGNETSGLILAQAEPGTFEIDGKTQLYVLADSDSIIIETNLTGLFVGLDNGIYNVFALNYCDADAALIEGYLVPGSSFGEFENGLMNPNHPLFGACYTFCPAEFEVNCDSPGALNVTLMACAMTVDTMANKVGMFDLTNALVINAPNDQIMEPCIGVDDSFANAGILLEEITFHVSYTDAENGVGAIVNVNTYIGLDSAVVFARLKVDSAALENACCAVIAEVLLTVKEVPFALPMNATVCSGNADSPIMVDIDGNPQVQNGGTVENSSWTIVNDGGTGITVANLTNADMQIVTVDATDLDPGIVTLQYVYQEGIVGCLQANAQLCPALPALVEVIILQEPVVSSVSDFTVCPEDAIDAIALFAAPADPDNQVFSWTVVDADGVIDLVDGMSSGPNHEIPAFNATAIEGTATVKVAVDYTIDGVTCSSDTVEFTVTVEDAEGPLFTNCPVFDIWKTNDLDSCGATVSWEDPTLLDNCGVPGVGTFTVTITLDPPVDGCTPTPYMAGQTQSCHFPVGDTITVTYLADDGNGNTAECSFNVMILDEQAPVITECQEGELSEFNGVTFNTLPGLCYADIFFFYEATDNCDLSDTAFQVMTDPDGNLYTDTLFWNGALYEGATNPYTIGIWTYDIFISDLSGNTSSCTGTFTIADDELPTITCPTDGLDRFTDVGECGFTMPGVGFDAVVTDNCPDSIATHDYVAAPSSTTLAGAEFPVGSHDIVWTVTDGSGNSASCMFTVTVADTTAPEIACPTDTLSVATDPSNCTAIVNWSPPVVSDNCEIDTVIQTTGGESGTEFEVGLDTITYVVSDTAGNTASCSFIVEVLDTEDPDIDCPSNNVVVSADDNCEWVGDNQVNVSDSNENCPFIIEYEITGVTTVARAEGNAVGETFALGESEVCYFIMNLDGDMVDSCCFLVIVEDNDGPVIANCNELSLFGFGVEILQVNEGTCQFMGPGVFSAIDNCDGAIDTFYAVYTNPDQTIGTDTIINGIWNATFEVGVTTYEIVAFDAAGNETRCTGQVEVQDNEDPTITCPTEGLTRYTDEGVCTFTMPGTGFDPVFDDNCEAEITNDYILAPSDETLAGAAFPVGTTDVTWTATDGSGNIATCTFTVTVLDTVSPTIVCVDSIIVASDPSICAAIVNWSIPATADNCAVDTLIQTAGLISGSEFPVGIDTITYVVSDTSGNTAECSFIVEVLDTQDPDIDCPSNNVVVSADENCEWVGDNQVNVSDSNENCPFIIEYEITGVTTVARTEGNAVGETFALGESEVCYFIMNLDGDMVDSCCFLVIVEDNDGPVIANCNELSLFGFGLQVLQVNAGTCQFMGPGGFSATDNCDGVIDTLYAVYTNPDLTIDTATIVNNTWNATFEVGITTYEIVAFDSVGNETRCTGQIEVQDNENPTITCPEEGEGEDGLTVYTDEGVCTFTVPDDAFDPEFDDNCGAEITNDYILAPSDETLAGAAFPVGTTDVIWTATDESGNTATCMFTMTVLDTVSPTIVCIDSIIVSADPSNCAATVNWAPPVTDDNCAVDTLIQTAGPISGSEFPVGIDTITYVVSDTSGNTAECSFIVEVIDTENPDIDCPSNNVVASTDEGTCQWISDNQVNVSDSNENCPFIIEYEITGATTAARVEGNAVGDTFELGESEVCYFIMNLDGDMVDSCCFLVIVEDNEAPVITCPGDTVLYASADSCGVTLVYAEDLYAVDNCGDTLLPVSLEPIEFAFTGAAQEWIVPAGVTEVFIETFGASGGNSFGNQGPGGMGGFASGALAVTPGETLNIYVGGAGGEFLSSMPTCSENLGGFNGGGNAYSNWAGAGGGASDVRQGGSTLAERAIVAGGGGGSSIFNASGGAGGGLVGAMGGSWAPRNGGEGGTQTAGGSGDSPGTCGFAGSTADGVLGQGGLGHGNNVGGGGGGGGYYGGGGSLDAAGGGGSSYIDGLTDGMTTQGGNVGDGLVRITPGLNPIVQTVGLPSGSFFAVGEHINTFVATDSSGNMSTCSFTVTVLDTIAPILTCPADTVVFTSTDMLGECSALVELTLPEIIENCNIEEYTVSFTNPDNSIDGPVDLTSFFPVFSDSIVPRIFDVGVTTVTFYVADGSGNSDTCTYNVTVLDDTDPTIVCPTDTLTVSADPSNCAAFVNWAPPVTDDNCAVDTLIQTAGPISGSEFPVGIDTITYVVSDSSGNTAECSFIVEVIDTEEPDIDCPSNDVVASTDIGTCAWVADNSVNVSDSSENCPFIIEFEVTGATIIARTEGNAVGETFELGLSEVCYFILNLDGDMVDSCCFNVIVEDNEAPMITCPDFNLEGGLPTEAWINEIHYDNSGSDVGEFIEIAGPAGLDLSGYDVVLYNGNGGSMYSTLTLSGVIPDEIAGFGALDFDKSGIQNGGPDGMALVNNGVVVELISYEGIFVAADGPAVGMTSTDIGVSEPGSTPVGFSIKNNGSGLAAVWEGPAVESRGLLNANQSIDSLESMDELVFYTNPDECVATIEGLEATATDNCTEPTITNNGEGDGMGSGSGDYAPGEYTITWTAEDSSGNTSTCELSFTVLDTMSPEIVCPENLEVFADANDCGGVVMWAHPDPTDNCEVETFKITYLNPDSTIDGAFHVIDSLGSRSFGVGTTVITYIVTDNSGNTSSCSFEVSLTDTIAPTITCPADTITVATDVDDCSASVNWPLPVVDDNCGVDTLIQTTGGEPGSSFEVGFDTITYVVSDTAGNTSSCSFILEVIDTQDPDIDCPSNIVEVGTDEGVCTWVGDFQVAVVDSSENCPFDIEYEISGATIVARTAGSAEGVVFNKDTSEVCYFIMSDSTMVDSCCFLVIVIDDEDPVIECPGDTVIYSPDTLCGAVYDYVVIAEDNCAMSMDMDTLEFVFTGTVETWTVPAGVTEIMIEAFGAEGGSATLNNPWDPLDMMGGDGGFSAGILSVTPGETLEIRVGGKGSDALGAGYNGGGEIILGNFVGTQSSGGGASDIRQGGAALADRVIVAAGGGGAEWAGGARQAGQGGGLEGGVNGGGDVPGASGGIGTQANGGAAGPNQCIGFIDDGFPGDLGLGGNTASGHSGGGGGGYYGGGAGGCDGHGGGGSSYIAALGMGNTVAGVNLGNGSLRIIYASEGGMISVVQTEGLPSGSVFPIGTTVNTFVAMDSAGNESSCSFTVTVLDTISPVIDCPADTMLVGLVDGEIDCGFQLDIEIPSILEACGLEELYAVIINPDESQESPINLLVLQTVVEDSTIVWNFDIGTSEVIFYAEDPSGNTSSCSFEVTVVDSVMPFFQNCPDTLFFGNDPDQCSAFANWSAPVAFDNCDTPLDNVFQTAGPSSGSNLLVDSLYTVTYVATDDDGNTAECTFVIDVIDTECPEFVTTLPLNETVDCHNIPDTFILIPAWHTADNCTESDSITFEFVQDTIDYICAGTFTLKRKWTIFDEYGNNCFHIQKIYVIDTMGPIFTTPADTTVSCEVATDTSVTGQPTDITDLVGCSPDSLITVEWFDSTTQCGNQALCCNYMYTIWREWVLTDDCGNESRDTQIIDVVDMTAPDAVCQDITIYLDENGNVSISANDIDNGSSDNCAPLTALTLSISKAAFDCDDIGVDTVVLSVEDPCGNVGICVASVTILDTLIPTLVCPGDETITLDPGACEIIKYYEPQVLEDNCDIDSISIEPNGVPFPIGETEITIWVIDQGGNTAECTFSLTVLEYPDPITELTCNGEINVSLNSDCEATITPDMILEGGPYACYECYVVTLYEEEGGDPIPTSPMVTIDHIGIQLIAEIQDTCNGGNICWGYVNVENKLTPDVICPPDMIMPCNAMADPDITGLPVPTSCPGPGAFTIEYDDEIIDNDKCGIEDDPEGESRVEIVRTWTVTDFYGNSTECVQLIQIVPFRLEQVVGPENYDDFENPSFSCAEVEADPSLVHPENTGYPLLSALDTVITVDTNLVFGLDDSNNVVVDTVITIDTVYMADLIGLIELVPNEMPFCDFTFNYFDDTLYGCGGSYEILRTWIISSICEPLSDDNPIEIKQRILVWDNQDPVIQGPDTIVLSTVVDQCYAVWPVSPPQVIGECSGFDWNVSASNGDLIVLGPNDYVLNNIPVGETEVIYVVTDDCYNQSYKTVTIIVNDDQSPTAVCDEFTVVGLNVDGTSEVYAESFDDGSHDNCNEVYFKVIRLEELCGSLNGFKGGFNDCLTCDGLNADLVNNDDDPFTPGQQVYFDDVVRFCCDDAGVDSIMIVMRVFEVDPGEGPVDPSRMDPGGDLYNAYNDCQIFAHVEDELPPVAICLPDITVGCEFEFDEVAISDPNDETFGKIVEDPNDREPIVIDGHGNPNFDEDHVWGLDGLAADQCDYTIDIQVSVNRECGQGVVTRVITVTDQGGKEAQCVQRIFFESFNPFNEDNIDWPDNVELADICLEDVIADPEVAGMPEYDDDICANILMSIENDTFVQDGNACVKILRTWKVLDWCQFDENTGAGLWSHIQVIKLTNEVAPEFTGEEELYVCDSAATGCEGFIEIVIVVEDDCSAEVDVTYNLDANNDGDFDIVNVQGTDASGSYPFGTHRIVWTATDGCGNTSTFEQIFTVDDCKKPSPKCFSGLVTVLMESGGTVDIWASEFDAGSEDNCGDVILSFSEDTSETSITFTCDDLGTQTVQIWVTDEYGNQDFCETFLFIQDNSEVCDSMNGLISGIVHTVDLETVNGVQVNLDVAPGIDYLSMTTGNDGAFEFEPITFHVDYELSGYKNDDPTNGVSTYDIVKIQKHLLAIEEFDSPYKYIAADANNSQHVTAADMIQIRKLILGEFSEFPDNTSWRFVVEDFEFEDPTDPWPFDEMVEFVDFDENESIDNNFYAVKIGDLTGNAEVNELLGVEDRSLDGSLNFIIEDESIETGEEIKIDFRASDFNSVLGYQFTFKWDASILDFERVEGGILEISESNFGMQRVDEGLMSTSWSEGEGMTVENDEILFSIVMTAKDNDIMLSEVLTVSDEITAIEAYADKKTDLGVSLLWRVDNQTAVSSWALLQNSPNPFDKETVIGFEVAERSEVSFKVYDGSGKVAMTINDTYEAGYHQVTVKRSDLGASGVWYYEISADAESSNNTFTQTRKMILLD